MALKVYEDQKADMKGMWMLSFSSEFELGQFEHALAIRWKDIYQVREWDDGWILPAPRHPAPASCRLTSSSLRCWTLLSKQEQNVPWNSF